MKKLFTYPFAIILLVLSVSTEAQTTFQVVTKTIEKTFPYQHGSELNIEVERAEILVETWTKN